MVACSPTGSMYVVCRSGKYLEAKKQLEELLKIAPDSHQATSLKKASANIELKVHCSASWAFDEQIFCAWCADRACTVICKALVRPDMQLRCTCRRWMMRSSRTVSLEWGWWGVWWA